MCLISDDSHTHTHTLSQSIDFNDRVSIYCVVRFWNLRGAFNFFGSHFAGWPTIDALRWLDGRCCNRRNVHTTNWRVGGFVGSCAFLLCSLLCNMICGQCRDQVTVTSSAQLTVGDPRVLLARACVCLCVCVEPYWNACAYVRLNKQLKLTMALSQRCSLAALVVFVSMHKSVLSYGALHRTAER